MPRTMERLERTALGAVYAGLTLAGPLAVIYTPPSMQEVVGNTWATVWGFYLLLGAAGCLVGVLSGAWLWEFMCLHLLGSALAVYGLVVLNTVDGEPGRVAGGLILLAFSGLLFVTWLQRLREARADARRPAVRPRVLRSLVWVRGARRGNPRSARARG